MNAVPAEEDRNRTPIHKIVMGGMGGGGGGMGTLQVLPERALRPVQAPRHHEPVAQGSRHEAEAPAEVPDLHHDGVDLPEALDPALLRPGRLDRIYRVGYPNKEGRVKTLEGYLNKVDHELTPEQIDDLAIKTPYYSGAKIKDIVNEALIIAIRDDRKAVTYDDIWKAKVHKELGPSDNTDYIERERHAVAVHEACHAVIAHLTSTRNTIDLATIERHQNALGMVVPIQLEDRATRWRTEFEADVMVSLASLAGEKMFFEGDNSSGVSADLRNATAQASYMMGLYGMGDNISSLAAMGQARFGTTDPSPDILKRMGPRVEGLLQELYERTEVILEEYREKVLEVAAALEEHKTISGDDITEIMGTEPGVLAKDREGTWLQVDPNRALNAAGNGEAGDVKGELTADVNGEVTEDVTEADEELDPV